MKEFQYVIQDPVGLHARPAGLLVKQAGSFSSKVTVESGGKSADARKLIMLMSWASNREWKLPARWKAKMKRRQQRLYRSSSRRIFRGI